MILTGPLGRKVQLFLKTLGQQESNSEIGTKVKETPDDIEKDEECECVNKAEEDVECPLEQKLKIHSIITTKILPQLHKCLTNKVGVLSCCFSILFCNFIGVLL